MNTDAVERIADAILYEGYLLYPYRRSALKNQRRWDFGIVYPPGREPENEPSLLRTECIAELHGDASVDIQLRFLQIAPSATPEDAIPRVVSASHSLSDQRKVTRFEFPPSIQGALEVITESLQASAIRLSVSISNTVNSPEDRAASSLLSTHAILSITGGEFVSLLDPPERYRNHAAECRNSGLWPVLAGEPDRRNVMLASPIILSDYPRIAPESAGDLFDGTEIDELLSMRVRTLTDSEKQEVRSGDPRGREILERSERLSADELLRLHGTMRSSDVALGGAVHAGLGVKPGDRVRLCPQGRADVFDLALKGRTARIESIEQDYEGRVHLAVVVDDDPGRDLGAMRHVGHRFFFALEEVERIDS